MEKVEIKSLVYGGAGVGHLDNGKTVFVDDVVDADGVGGAEADGRLINVGDGG